MLRHLWNLERPNVRQHALLVELQEWQLHRKRARGDDHVLRAVGLRLSVGAGDIDQVAFLERAATLRPRHLVLAEQVLDAPGVRPNDGILPRHHRRQIQLHVTDFHPVLGRMQLGEFEMLRGCQQRLRWNAPDVDARAAERLVHLDANCIEAELPRAYCCYISTGSAADDRYIAVDHLFDKHRGWIFDELLHAYEEYDRLLAV